ncbi:MAG: hypothetical protein MUO36_00470, partial [Candidatus Hadarchaeum sp.]|nr:hypothetical protein [Candidatus Hadarchaeum sp.]
MRDEQETLAAAGVFGLRLPRFFTARSIFSFPLSVFQLFLHVRASRISRENATEAHCRVPLRREEPSKLGATAPAMFSFFFQVLQPCGASMIRCARRWLLLTVIASSVLSAGAQT